MVLHVYICPEFLENGSYDSNKNLWLNVFCDEKLIRPAAIFRKTSFQPVTQSSLIEKYQNAFPRTINFPRTTNNFHENQEQGS